MIRSLYIQNFAIISQLEVRFGHGLNIVTGETGAGKSIMLDALGLVLGRRADSTVLINKDDKCIVEAEFDISSRDLRRFFDKHEVDHDNHTIVRREISPNGRTRAFVNDTPVNLSFLSELADHLIEVHQQFDHLSIREETFQRSVIDTLADQIGLVSEFKTKFQNWSTGKRQLEQIKERAARDVQELDFVSFQLDELNAADLVAGEEKELNDELKLLSQADDIKKVLHSSSQYLSESEDNLVDTIKKMSSEFRAFAGQEALSQIKERLENVAMECEDVSREAQRLLDAVEVDPGRMMQIEERISVLFRLVQKHNAQDVDDLLCVRDRLRDRMAALRSSGENLAALELDLDAQRSWLDEVAMSLSKKRSAILNTFEKSIEETLRHLGMPDAVFKVDISPKEMDDSGTDQILFTFSSNKGIPPAPIKLTASGGEISRLNLAVKSQIAGKLSLPTMILDEIDAGVSGETARRIGRMLTNLGKDHQIVCITHTPQIASMGTTHLHVVKVVIDEKSSTQVKTLSQAERIDVVGQMLGGDPPGLAALEAARALLSDSELTV